MSHLLEQISALFLNPAVDFTTCLWSSSLRDIHSLVFSFLAFNVTKIKLITFVKLVWDSFKFIFSVWYRDCSMYGNYLIKQNPREIYWVGKHISQIFMASLKTRQFDEG